MLKLPLPPANPAQPHTPASMQPLQQSELRAIVGGPVIKNGGGIGVTTPDSAN